MPTVVVIGAGLGGLAAAIELKQRGFDDLLVLEKGADVGGVWRDNTYPGAACDVPSPFYSYSFEPNPYWPRRYSRQPAILEYVRKVADKYDLRRHIRLNREVLAASFDDTTNKWLLEVDHAGAQESLVADVLVPAVGQLSRPAIPEIRGAERFAGPAFHSARWDHGVELEGKRVAVVGTGASAIQFVPELQRRAAHVSVFQRTPPYIVPRPDRPFGPIHHRVFSTLPVTQLLERAAWYGVGETLSIAWAYSQPLAARVRALSEWHMRRQTEAEPGLFEKVWPDYPIGCKRILFSSDYLPALTQENAELITEPIAEITPEAVLSDDGVEHPADVLIWGTGFAAADFLAPMRIRGRGGAELSDAWREGAHAYCGMTVPDFPNMLIMYGPNTNTGGGSIIYFLEAQAKYLADFVEHSAALGAPLSVRAQVEADYNAHIQSRLSTSVWSQCDSWYRNADGKITANWPLLGREYKARAQFAAGDYEPVSR
ncbi:MAG: NAD(P)/FAD-dependent oxidoreductase [Solirubrobacterales bacterium]|nr:NAD(P)/FAD-dependent oxidoreductase [Solirubrobacterales bacterium]